MIVCCKVSDIEHEICCHHLGCRMYLVESESVVP